MKNDLLNDLLANETDVEGALKRLFGDESLYVVLLNAFIEDKTMVQLEEAVKSCSWDEAFTAAHALKGLAGNMGFVPLFHSIGELVVLIRNGRVDEIDGALKKVRQYYDEIISVIRNNKCD